MNAQVSDTALTTLQDSSPIPVGPGISIYPLVKLSADLDQFDVNAIDIEGQVERAVVDDAAKYQAGSDLLSAISVELKHLEEKRVEVKKPADDYGAMVQKLVKPIKDRLEAAKTGLSKKMLVWRNAEEARERAAQEEIRKQQQAEAERLAAKAREQGNESTAERIEEMVAAAPVAPAPKIGHANVYGRTTQKRVYWKGTSHDVMEMLRQVIAGNIPVHVVEFSPSGLNTLAAKYIESLPEADRKECVHLGIKISKEEKLI